MTKENLTEIARANHLKMEAALKIREILDAVATEIDGMTAMIHGCEDSDILALVTDDDE